MVDARIWNAAAADYYSHPRKSRGSCIRWHEETACFPQVGLFTSQLEVTFNPSFRSITSVFKL
jgi:hypothetical protein